MLKPIAFANAVTVVTGVFYILCVVLSAIMPDVLFGIFQSWIHSVNINILKATNAISIDAVIYGLITISAITWITTYTSIWLYNRFAGK